MRTARPVEAAPVLGVDAELCGAHHHLLEVDTWLEPAKLELKAEAVAGGDAEAGLEAELEVPLLGIGWASLVDAPVTEPDPGAAIALA